MRGSKEEYDKIHKTVGEVEYKLCSDCNEWYLMTEEYFYKNKTNYIDGYYPYCKECAKKRARKWQVDNPERANELKMIHSLKQDAKVKHRKRSKKSREIGNYKRWQLKNKDKLQQYNKARQQKNHDITIQEWNDCKLYFDNSCAYCGLHIDDHYIIYAGNPKKTDLHREHVDDNGANDLSNCIPSCQGCNSEKWTFDFDEWYSKDNPFYTIERLNKIKQWLEHDYKLYIRKELQNT